MAEDWFSKGFEGTEERVKQADERRKNQAPWRIWIPERKSITLVFLDEEAFSFDEHQVRINGDWKNWFTCIGKSKGCPLCLSKMYPYRATVFTVIDRSVWKDKKGVERRDEKRLYVVKDHTALLLKEKSKRWGGLTGKEVIVSRKGKDDASSGSDFECAMKDGQIIKPDLSHVVDLKPYNYREMFAPMTSEELRKTMSIMDSDHDSGQAVSTAAGSAVSGGTVAEEIPF